MTEKVFQSRYCFVCGRDNPTGLNLPFVYDGKTVTAEFLPTADHCGFDGIVHAGILFALADEAMMHLIHARAIKAITAEVAIRFKRHAPIDELLTVRTGPLKIGAHMAECSATVADKGGSTICAASGKFLYYQGKQSYHKTW